MKENLCTLSKRWKRKEKGGEKKSIKTTLFIIQNHVCHHWKALDIPL